MALQRMSQIFHARSDFDGDFPAVAGNVFLISDVSARGDPWISRFCKTSAAAPSTATDSGCGFPLPFNNGPKLGGI